MMAFLHVKANFGKPHGKASYIRPLNGCSDGDNVLKQFEKNENYETFQLEDELSSLGKCSPSIKNIDDSKEKHLQKLTSAHTHLSSEIEKIQMWKTSVELECNKKSKKLEELSRVIESQRKVVYDLQMQNEMLSSQLNEEIQQRVSVMEKFYFTKELCSILKKKFHELQDQLEGYKKIKENSDAGNEQKLKVIEDITKKFNSMSIEHSERINYLNDALTNQRNNTLILKNLCEQQNIKAEIEHKSFCNLMEKYQDELKAASKNLENAKKKNIYLEQEKKELILRISDLETKNDTNLRKLKESELELKHAMDIKCETENSYKSEVIKVNELNVKCKELEDLSNKQTTEFEEKFIDMKAAIDCLEKSLLDLKERSEECEKNNKDLSVAFQGIEREKNCLEDEILKIKNEKEMLQDKLLNDAKLHEETTCQLMMEKSNLTESLENVKEELHKAMCDKENISKLFLENEQKLSKITSDYQTAILKIEDLTFVSEKHSLTLQKVEELENNLKLNSELLFSKNLDIKEMNMIKEKYFESQNKLEELEISLQLKSEELLLKDQKLKEMIILREKYAESQNKLKELEGSLQLISEELYLKEKTVEDLNTTKENIVKARSEINRLECDLQTKQELILSKESKIEELTVIEENYELAILKIQKLEKDINCKSELLDSKEKMIANLKTTLRENENMLDKLQYENIEMKDNLAKEKESVQICLECEILKEKLNEFENMQMALNQTQEEVNKQKDRGDRILKMLSETEDNFDDMRVKKEKQIIKLNDTVEDLQHKLRILKEQIKDTEHLQAENETLKRKVDEIILQNEGDMQRLKAENLKMKLYVETPRSQKNLSEINPGSNNVPRKKAKNSPFSQEIENDQKMEADSSHGDDVPIEKAPQNSKIDDVTLTAEKRKLMWESGSSGSECLEIVFDSKANGIKGFIPKPKTPGGANKTPAAGSKQKIFQDKKKYLPVKDEVYNFTDNQKPKIPNTLSVKPLIKVAVKNQVNSDFLKSKENVTQINFCSTPLIKRKLPVGKGTPTTPSERKFFKTPLKERESSFKNPRSMNLWC